MKNTKGLLKSAINLKKVFGENISLKEIIEKLEVEVNKQVLLTNEKYENLRDFLISELIESLISRYCIENISPKTLGALTKVNLKDVLESYFEYTNDTRNNCPANEVNTAYLFDSCGGDALNYLQDCINESIEKWGLDKDITDFSSYNNDKKISISTIGFEWIFRTLIDDYDCRNECGSVMELFEAEHGEDSVLENLSVKEMYDFVENPYDFDDDNEIQRIQIERTCSVPTETEFFLLVWKYFALEK